MPNPARGQCILDLLPSTRVGHVGIYRDPRTLQAIEYYLKLPEDLPEHDVILCDPMPATGNSALSDIAPQGDSRPARSSMSALSLRRKGSKSHVNLSGLPIVAAALDRCLDEAGYFLPGSATPATTSPARK